MFCFGVGVNFKPFFNKVISLFESFLEEMFITFGSLVSSFGFADSFGVVCGVEYVYSVVDNSGVGADLKNEMGFCKESHFLFLGFRSVRVLFLILAWMVFGIL